MPVMETGKTEFAVTLGQRIKLLRKKRGIKQRTLGEMLGYKSHTAIVYLEAGEQVLSVETAVALARALDVSLVDLLGELVFDDSQKEYHEPWMVTLREKILTTPQAYRESLADMLETLAIGLRATAAHA